MNIRHQITAILLGALIGLSLPNKSYAQSPQPIEIQAVYACKSLTDSAERLACYDNAVGRLEAAEESGEVVTISKSEVEKVERDAFGFNIPSLPGLNKLFGGRKKAKSERTKDNPLTAPVETAVITQRPVVKPKEQRIERPKASDIKEVSLEIRKTTEFGYGKTRFFFTNGQVWEQTRAEKIRIPKTRDGKVNTAEISKASLGSFLLQVNGKGKATRVRRVR